jgi:hypothetical protein
LDLPQGVGVGGLQRAPCNPILSRENVDSNAFISLNKLGCVALEAILGGDQHTLVVAVEQVEGFGLPIWSLRASLRSVAASLGPTSELRAATVEVWPRTESRVGPLSFCKDNAATIYVIANTGAMLDIGQERSKEKTALTAEPHCG